MLDLVPKIFGHSAIIGKGGERGNPSFAPLLRLRPDVPGSAQLSPILGSRPFSISIQASMTSFMSATSTPLFSSSEARSFRSPTLWVFIQDSTSGSKSVVRFDPLSCFVVCIPSEDIPSDLRQTIIRIIMFTIYRFSTLCRTMVPNNAIDIYFQHWPLDIVPRSFPTI